MTFDSPLYFPNSNIKCEVENDIKDKEIEITCKGLKKSKNCFNKILKNRF